MRVSFCSDHEGPVKISVSGVSNYPPEVVLTAQLKNCFDEISIHFPSAAAAEEFGREVVRLAQAQADATKEPVAA